MENSKQVLTPIVDIGTNADPKVTKSGKSFPYRELIGILQYLSTKTRPDISFAINYANRFKSIRLKSIKPRYY